MCILIRRQMADFELAPTEKPEILFSPLRPVSATPLKEPTGFRGFPQNPWISFAFLCHQILQSLIIHVRKTDLQLSTILRERN